MLPLVDLHCHLLAGLDDGPRTLEAALEMCAIASADGVRLMAATAHQNPRWRDVTPERIRVEPATLVYGSRSSPVAARPGAARPG